MPQETVPRILGGGANPLFTICHHVLLRRIDTEGFLGRVSGSWSTAHFVLRHKAHHTLLPHPFFMLVHKKEAFCLPDSAIRSRLLRQEREDRTKVEIYGL